MRAINRYTCLVLSFVALSLGTGCNKKAPTVTPDSEIATVTAKLPAAAEVKKALERKDYDAAMAALLKLKETITTEDQQVQFVALTHWLKQQLLESPDAKALEALNALRAMNASR